MDYFSLLTVILIVLILFALYHIARFVWYLLLLPFFSGKYKKFNQKTEAIQRHQQKINALTALECERQLENLAALNKLVVKSVAGSAEQQAWLTKLHPALRTFFQKYPSIAVPGGISIGINQFSLPDPKMQMTRRNGIPKQTPLLQIGEDEDFIIFANFIEQSPALYEYDKDEFLLDPGSDTPYRMLLLDYVCVEMEKKI